MGQTLQTVIRGSEVNDKLESIYFHDAILKGIAIDRTNPGHSDTVCMLVELESGVEIEITFRDCYFFFAAMNFGVVADESIRSLVIASSGDDIERIRNAYVGAGDQLATLKSYNIETNSTGSVLKICCLSYTIIYL